MRRVADGQLHLHAEPDALRGGARVLQNAGACVVDAAAVGPATSALSATGQCSVADLHEENMVLQGHVHVLLELRPQLQVRKHERGAVEGPLRGVALLDAEPAAPSLR